MDPSRINSHRCSSSENVLTQIVKPARNLLGYLVKPLGDLRGNTFVLMKVFRIVAVSLQAINYRRGVSPDVLKFCDKLEMTDSVVSSFLLCGPIEYITTRHKEGEDAYSYEKDRKEKRYWSVLGNASFGAVGVGLILSVLDGVGLLSLANWGAQLRKISFLERTICKISFDTAVTVGASLGFFSIAVDKRLNLPPDKPENTFKRRSDMIAVAWFVSEIVADALTFSSASFPILTGFRAGAALLGIASHLYHESLDKPKGPQRVYDPIMLETRA